MTSLVEQLTIWVTNNSQTLCGSGFQIIQKIPLPGSDLAWKASIGLIHDEILVSYTVWDKSILRTELIVMNALTEETIVMEDKSASDPNAVHFDLDGVVRKLKDSSYKNMKPDPKLIIT